MNTYLPFLFLRIYYIIATSIYLIAPLHILLIFPQLRLISSLLKLKLTRSATMKLCYKAMLKLEIM